MGIPMAIAVLLLIAWLFSRGKKINLYVVCSVLFLCVMAIGTLLATNTYSAYVATEAMAIVVLCTCLPLILFVDSLRKVKIFVDALIGIFVYVGIWTIVSGGRGPGWQDENYAAAMMCIAIPLAYFSMFPAKSYLAKLYYATAIGVFLVALIASESRGGFVGLLGIALFCVLWSPHKRQAIAALAVATALALAVAGPKYWDDMATITDTKESTADMRLELWAIAWRMFLHNPLLGVGPGNYRWRVGEYQSPEQLEKFGRVLTESIVVHSTYFELVSEVGLLGSGLFIAILVRVVRDLGRLAWAAGSAERSASKKPWGGGGPHGRVNQLPEARRLRFLALAILGALVGFLVPAAFISYSYYSQFWLLTALAVALRQVVERDFQNVCGGTDTPWRPRHYMTGSPN